MKTNYLVPMVGISGILFCGYFLILGKDVTTSLIGFICGASLLFLWSNFKNPIHFSKLNYKIKILVPQNDQKKTW